MIWKSFWCGMFIFLGACSTPVYVDKKVLIPTMVSCKVTLPALVTLPSEGTYPRTWQDQLSLTLEDLKVLKKELDETRVAAKGCD